MDRNSIFQNLTFRRSIGNHWKIESFCLPKNLSFEIHSQLCGNLPKLLKVSHILFKIVVNRSNKVQNNRMAQK